MLEKCVFELKKSPKIEPSLYKNSRLRNTIYENIHSVMGNKDTKVLGMEFHFGNDLFKYNSVI